MPDDDQDHQSVQLRALLAFALSAVVLFVYQHYFVKPAPPPPPPKPAVTESKPAAAAPQPQPAVAAPAKTPATTPTLAASAEQTFLIETDTYLVSLSNRGAVVTSWTLKKYKDESGKPLELVNRQSALEVGFPFAYAAQSDLNQALFRATTSPASGAATMPAPISVAFEWSDGNLTARKTFRFSRDSYVVDVDSGLTQSGAPVPHLLTWRGGFGDFAAPDALAHIRTFYFDNVQNKVVAHDAKEAQKNPVDKGNFLYAGIEDHYFAAAFITKDPSRPMQLETTAFETTPPGEQRKQAIPGAAIGSDGANQYSVYVGPKSLETLRAVRPQLAQLIDFGFFSFIAYPLFLILTWTHRYVPNFGWVIVLVTIAINFILFPLKLKSMTSMKKMQRIQPLIKQINDRYKNLGMRDPKRQEQNQEVMALYNRYGVNPLGGCLPMLLQLPFFFAFYRVLSDTIEMRQATWLWVRDLSTWDHIYILPIAMVATQFWYQKMTPATSTDPAQQRMMQFMPLIMGFFFFKLPSGLVLYWLTGNLVGIAQQWFINRLPEPALEIEKPKKGKGKAGR